MMQTENKLLFGKNDIFIKFKKNGSYIGKHVEVKKKRDVNK